ncbi:hypothetical protein Pmani_028070 [Petrolisthes manimaculis]|uniref:Ig-like domain-containing protein n=1 Tax=Petrolisthes manimaculis TaxID=1843537 RepID=A0AAE1P0U2_9EUCA|nr:hypothetical protein Pmani_028070 [Petrolisthes manimaculis]
MAGESDMYVKSGSTVNIKCVITDAPQEPTYIFWYHGDRRVVRGNSDRILTVDRKPPDTSIGTLTIPAVTLADSGNYTCAPASLKTASVMLHVLSGEHPEAMQSGTNSGGGTTTTTAAGAADQRCDVVVTAVITLLCLLVHGAT